MFGSVVASEQDPGPTAELDPADARTPSVLYKTELGVQRN
jgi:hypothetical protein